MKNILITGGAGYIGSQIAYDLIDKNFNVLIIDNLTTGTKKVVPKKAKFFDCDISNLKEIKRIIKKNHIDIVIHCAGSISVEESIMKPKKYNYNNFLKTKKFVNFCIKHNIKNFIFSSTAAIYKEDNKNKIGENFFKKPQNPYGISKLKCENFFLKKKNIKLFILRYFNVAGADDKLRTGPIIDNNSTHLIKKIIQTYFNKKSIFKIFGKDYPTHDGTAIRDFIYIKDLSLIHLYCIKSLKKMENNKNIVLNCGYGVGYSVLDVVKAALKIFKFKYKFVKKRKGDNSMLVSNNSKMKKILNINLKKKSLKKMILSALQWEKHYRKKFI